MRINPFPPASTESLLLQAHVRIRRWRLALLSVPRVTAGTVPQALGRGGSRDMASKRQVRLNEATVSCWSQEGDTALQTSSLGLSCSTRADA